MRIKRQSGFGHLGFLVRVGAIKLPNAKSCTEILNDLAHFSYIPCSRRSLVLHFLHTKKKRIPNFWYVFPWDHYFHQKKIIENQLRYSSLDLTIYENLEKCCQNH